MLSTQKKYELVHPPVLCIVGGNTSSLGASRFLYRIKALISFGSVQAGDIGGFVDGEHNLSHNNDCWIFDDAKVYDSAYVSGNAIIRDRSEVFNCALIGENASITGISKISNNAIILGNYFGHDVDINSGLHTANTQTQTQSINNIGNVAPINNINNNWLSQPIYQNIPQPLGIVEPSTTISFSVTDNYFLNNPTKELIKPSSDGPSKLFATITPQDGLILVKENWEKYNTDEYARAFTNILGECFDFRMAWKFQNDENVIMSYEPQTKELFLLKEPEDRFTYWVFEKAKKIIKETKW